MGKTRVLSYGGSLIWRRGKYELNKKSMLEFSRTLFEEYVKGKSLFVVVGGGQPARLYRDALQKELYKELYNPENGDFIPDSLRGVEDELGIKITRLNAELVGFALQYFFAPVFNYPTNEPYEFKKIDDLKHLFSVSEDLDTAIKLLRKYGISLMGGIKPGQTTDKVAFEACEYLHENELINLTNEDGIYDPRTYPEKKEIIREIGVDSLKQLIETLENKQNGGKHKPGLNFPIEPSVVKEIAESGLDITIHVLNGNLNSTNRLKNFRNLLEGKDYFGTKILPKLK